MNSLILKILGAGFVGVLGTCGAYVGIREDIKWKKSIDYPPYYWNKYNKSQGEAFKYSEEDKWEFLFNQTKFYFWFEKAKEDDNVDNEEKIRKWAPDDAFQSDVIDKVKNKITSDGNSTDTFLKNIDDSWESRKNDSKFSKISESEEWKKYRELCVVILREYVTSNDREKEGKIRNNCVLKPYASPEYKKYLEKQSDYSSESTFWNKYIKFKTKSDGK